MKITKARFKQIIKEEVQNFKNELQEGDATSRAISRLEDIGTTVKDTLQISDDPETIERLERVDQMITELWDQMHELLTVPSNNVQMHQQDQE
jgi:hypothetical protein